MTIPITGIAVVVRDGRDELTVTSVSTLDDARRIVAEHGLGREHAAIVDGAGGVVGECDWLEFRDGRVGVRGARRFEILSRSGSGLAYVRERRSRIMRVLTEEELDAFNDPPPCPECAEQFGCEHFNVAGEPLLSEDEIREVVPAEWVRFAMQTGVSRQDVERLRFLEASGDEYRVAEGVDADVRTLELLLLLNGES